MPCECFDVAGAAAEKRIEPGFEQQSKGRGRWRSTPERSGFVDCAEMKLPIAPTIRLLHSVDRNRRRLAGFNLVGGIVITTLLVFAAQDTPYPPAVGFALALLIGGALTFATVWVSLCFGGSGQTEEPSRKRASRSGSDQES